SACSSFARSSPSISRCSAATSRHTRSTLERSVWACSERWTSIAKLPVPDSGIRQRNLLHQEDNTERFAVRARQLRAAYRAAHRPAPSVAAVERQLGPLGLTGEHRANGLPELLDREPDVEVHEMAALHLTGPQAPQVLGAVVPREHLELRVDHDDGDLEPGQDRVEEGV